MAQARIDEEQYINAMIGCFTELGVPYRVWTGGAVTPILAADDDGVIAPGEEELANDASEHCGKTVPLPPLAVAPADGEAYRKMLDVRECLVAQGYDPGSPPSEDVWIEQVLSDKAEWGPYDALMPQPEHPGAGLSPAELAALMDGCPQSGRALVWVFTPN